MIPLSGDYGWIDGFLRGKAVACRPSHEAFGVIDASGNEMLPMEYEAVRLFGDGYIVSRKRGKSRSVSFGTRKRKSPWMSTRWGRSADNWRG